MNAPTAPRSFRTTHWSLVRQAAMTLDEPTSEKIKGELGELLTCV
jgi:hypothetical protein